MEAIDAEAWLKEIEEARASYSRINPDSQNDMYSTWLGELHEAVKQREKVKVRPLIEAHWIRVPSSDTSTGVAYTCSNCGKMRWGSYLPKFCQCCGATMLGVK